MYACACTRVHVRMCRTVADDDGGLAAGEVEGRGVRVRVAVVPLDHLARGVHAP